MRLKASPALKGLRMGLIIKAIIDQLRDQKKSSRPKSVRYVRIKVIPSSNNRSHGVVG